MDNATFWNLYNNGNIFTKVYSFGNDKKNVEICSFEYDGKFYLRIVSSEKYLLDRTAECGKKYRMNNQNAFIKAFDNKNNANKYFIAIKKNYIG